MPLILAAIAILLALALVVVTFPLALIQRYRRGTAQRLARGWVATGNLALMAFSTVSFLSLAALVDLWVPRAFAYVALGLVTGSLLGVGGLLSTRWEVTPRALHYTPNRWLVLSVTALVSARVVYGIWRGWKAWGATTDDSSWLAAAGAAGSMGAGAVVLGYYLMFWAGIRYRVHANRTLTGR